MTDIVLDCYWLAKYYGCHPDEFLRRSLSELFLHIHWTNRLMEKIAEMQAQDER